MGVLGCIDCFVAAASAPWRTAPPSTAALRGLATSVGLDESGPAECGGGTWTSQHFGRSGRKWSGRVWGSLASNSKIPSATTSVGLAVGPCEPFNDAPSATTSVGRTKWSASVGHLRTFQRYHPRPLRSVWTKVVRPSVGVTCEQFKGTIRDHFGRSGRKWSGRVWGHLRTFQIVVGECGPRVVLRPVSDIRSVWTKVVRPSVGSLANLSMMPHPRPLRSVWTIVVRPSVGVTCEQFKDTIRDHFGRSGRKWSGRVGVPMATKHWSGGWLSDGR